VKGLLVASLVLFTVFFSLVGKSQTNDGRSFFKNSIKIHIVTPRININWKSPRSLALSTLLNSAGQDFAPIGHFGVEILCDQPYVNGVKHVLTGMERVSKKASQRTTIKKKLGLGSLVYGFPGDLQSYYSSAKEFIEARRQGRLLSVTIPTNSNRCQSAMEFLDLWIKNGSYTVYGGAKNVSAGEGSGCADFALKFFHIATGVMPLPELSANVMVPKDLIGDGDQKRVSFTKVLTRTSWEKVPEKALAFSSPDTDKVVRFVTKNSAGFKRFDRGTRHLVYIRHLLKDSEVATVNLPLMSAAYLGFLKSKLESLGHYKQGVDQFLFKYPLRESVEATWDRIIYRPELVNFSAKKKSSTN
jgi:hypothetical protein